MLDDRIRERIEHLRLVLGSGEKPASVTSARRQNPIDGLGNSEEIQTDRGKCLLIEVPVGRYVNWDEVSRAVEILSIPSPVAFLDLETTGFSSTPLFLVAMVYEKQGELVCRQLLARDYSEECALIVELDRLLSGFASCVTFNGKSFDFPYIRDRARYHRLRLESNPYQFDLLHVARRMWKEHLPNCRLATLEWYILGRRRMGDVCGWEVPCIYHEFVHTKDATRLKSVIRHNLMDVLAMVELLICLAEEQEC